MVAREGVRLSLHCGHCGREVGETTHTRSSYRVDFYTLYTGDVEPTTVARRDDPSDTVTVQRLVRAHEVVTCVDCYGRPNVRRERERLFRVERDMEPMPEADAGS